MCLSIILVCITPFIVSEVITYLLDMIQLENYTTNIYNTSNIYNTTNISNIYNATYNYNFHYFYLSGNLSTY